MASLGVLNVNRKASGSGSVADDDAFSSSLTEIAAAGGGILLVPDGTYLLTTPIILPRVSQKGLIIQGAGRLNTKIVYTGSGYAFQFGNATTTDYAQYQGMRDLSFDLSSSGTPTGAVLFKSGFYNGLERVSILGPTGGSKILVYFDPGDGSYGNYHNYLDRCQLQGQTSASDVGIKLHSTSGNGANSNFIRDNWFGVFNQSVLIDGGDTNRITGNEFNGTTNTGVRLQSSGTIGNKIIENQFDGPTTNVDIAANVDGTVVADNSGGTAYVNAGTNTRQYNNTGAVWTGAGTFIEYQTVASASTITIPEGARVVRITGTTGITAINARPAGTVVTLSFVGAVALTDSASLNIGAAFTSTAEDTITLLCDGTNWLEISRSVN